MIIFVEFLVKIEGFWLKTYHFGSKTHFIYETRISCDSTSFIVAGT